MRGRSEEQEFRDEASVDAASKGPTPLTWASFRTMSAGERLFITLLFGLPLAACALASWIATDFLGKTTPLPFWATCLIGVPVGVLAIVFFVSTMGNDAGDWIIGSLIFLVVAGLAYPALLKAREKNLKKQRPALQQPHRPSSAAPPLRPNLRPASPQPSNLRGYLGRNGTIRNRYTSSGA